MRLYHGSNVKIDTIEPLRGKKGKDFGRVQQLVYFNGIILAWMNLLRDFSL